MEVITRKSSESHEDWKSILTASKTEVAAQESTYLSRYFIYMILSLASSATESTGALSHTVPRQVNYDCVHMENQRTPMHMNYIASPKLVTHH